MSWSRFKLGLAATVAVAATGAWAAKSDSDVAHYKADIAKAIGHPIAAAIESLGPPSKRSGAKYVWVVDKKSRDERHMLEDGHGYACTITLTTDKAGVIRKTALKGNDDGCLYLLNRNAPTPEVSP